MKALFIGRFQPFHNGHLRLISELTKCYDHIIIGIGSSQYSHTPENPFTFEERLEMITKALAEININNFSIIALPDIHDPPNWVKHVTNITSEFDIILTNNDFTTQLFKEKGYLIKHTPIYNREKFSGREIRRRIREHVSWKELVPPVIYHYITQIHGDKRINRINK
jgi:nicotinamide-nucleotide adenylyltransferase